MQDNHHLHFLELKLFLAFLSMTAIICLTVRYSPKIVRLMGPTGISEAFPGMS